MSNLVPSNPLTSITIKAVNSLLNSMPEESVKTICGKVVEVSLFADKQKTWLVFS